MRGWALPGAGAAIVATCMGGPLAWGARPDRCAIHASARLRPRRPAHPRGVLRALPRPAEDRGRPAARHARGPCSRAGTPAPPSCPATARPSLLYQKLIVDDPDKRMPRRRPPLTPRASRDRRAMDRPGARRGRRARFVQAASPAPDARPPRRPARPSPSPSIKDVRPILAANCYACHGPDRNRRQREPAPRPGGGRHGSPSVGPGRHRPRPPRDERALIQRVTGPGRAEAHAARVERQAAA